MTLFTLTIFVIYIYAFSRDSNLSLREDMKFQLGEQLSSLLGDSN